MLTSHFLKLFYKKAETKKKPLKHVKLITMSVVQFILCPFHIHYECLPYNLLYVPICL